MSTLIAKPRVVVVAGTTGVGKSEVCRPGSYRLKLMIIPARGDIGREIQRRSHQRGCVTAV